MKDQQGRQEAGESGGTRHVPGLGSGRRRGEACLSDLRLDQFLLAEAGTESLADTEKSQLLAHLETCPSCHAAAERLRQDRMEFLADAPLAALAADARDRSLREAVRHPWWRRFAAPVTVLAAAGMMFAWRPHRAEETNRAKGGGFSLSAYVQRDPAAGARPLQLGDSVAPGDKVAFRYSGAEGGFLTIVAADEAGAVSVYYPPETQSARVEGGQEIPLRTAVQLDATLGTELVVAVRCAESTSVALVRGALMAAVARARAAGRSLVDVGTLGLSCAESRLILTKVPLDKRP